MLDIQAPFVLPELRTKNRFLKRNFKALFDGLFQSREAPKRRAVVVVSHSGTIANMLFSHTGKEEVDVLKPRNASVIAIDDTGRLGLLHEGILPECKDGELHEYFTVPQFEQFARGTRFDYSPPRSCLLLLVRHGIAVSNVNKAVADGKLTRQGAESIAGTAMGISHALQQNNISGVDIFSSAYVRTRHTSELLYGMLVRQPMCPSPELSCLFHGGCCSETDSEESWLQGAAPVGF